MFDVTLISWSKVQVFHAKEVSIRGTALVIMCCQVGTLSSSARFTVCLYGYFMDVYFILNHRIIDQLGLEGSSWDNVVQPICQDRVTLSRLQRNVSRLVLCISRKEDSMTSLSSLFQCSSSSM